MDEEQHHQELVKGIAEQLKPVLEKSAQAIYVYLDDNHKVCNKKFADLLGYRSPQEWAGTDAPLADVIEKDQDTVVSAYMNASEKMMASSIDIAVKNVKTGKPIRVNVIMVPTAYKGHIFAVHFISKI